MTLPLPFTFYWAYETETAFDPSTMEVFDEDIFSLEVKHAEGQVPTLDMVVENPRIGLLAPGRKVWGWLGWQSPSGLIPLFFGVLVGVPTSLFQQKVTLQFIARSPQFIRNKQALAETMRHFPYYDAVYIDAAKRDDPDTILEGWSALWHIDRTTLDITASDILVGEDGNIEFTEGMAFYDSVSLTLGQAPLSNIRVSATVNWTQRTSGFFTVPTVNISSYTGETLESGWPKPGANIGGGYKCETSFVTDTYLVGATPTASYSSSWTNTDPDAGQCSTASESNSSSGPALLSPNPLICVLTSYNQSGDCDPFSDPPTNTPMTSQSTGNIIPLWNFSLDMTVRYDMNRQFTEELAFDMTANTQGILSSPTVAQHTETLTLAAVDVGQPLQQLNAWTDFQGGAVGIAQLIYPNNPTTPGGLSYQICVQAGTAGPGEPQFSDIPGETTEDNTVIWASLGQTSLTVAPGWSPASFVPLGQIILFRDQVFDPNTSDFEDVPGQSSYYLCTGAGQTNSTYTEFSFVPPTTFSLEPTPAIQHINYIARPAFVGGSGEGVGTIITDGTVQWTVLGDNPTLLGIPIGGTPDNVTARCYYPLDRGVLSAQYAIMRGRARLRYRARAVTVGWSCPFEFAVGLSCRHNATLFDPRLPGGASTGKVTSYSLIAGGDGKIYGKVETGVAIGFGDSIAEIDGTPEYASAGYMQVGYQRYDGAMTDPGSADVTYSPPVYVPFDDGLQPPLLWADVSDGGLISGDLASQKTAIEGSFQAARIIAYLNNLGGAPQTNASSSVQTSGISPDTAWVITREELALASSNTPYVMAANPISWSCLLKPCAGNGPFNATYSLNVSPLVIPMGINLEAPSSP